MKSDITALWSRILDSDHKAWRELVERYAALVYTVACRTGLSSSEAEDCAQQTWLSLYRKRRSIKDPLALPAWLIRTTHREAVRTNRDLKRTFNTGVEQELQGVHSPPDESITSLEFQMALKEGLKQLDPRCRKLITEMYLSNRKEKYKDVAAMLGVKPNSFGPLRKRCLIKLRDILKKMGYLMD